MATLCREQDAGAFRGKPELPTIPSPTPMRISQKNQDSKSNMPQSCTSAPVKRAKTWKPTEFPSREERVKEEAVHTYSGRRLDHETEGNNTNCGNPQGLVLSILRDVTQEKGRYHMISLLKN